MEMVYGQIKWECQIAHKNAKIVNAIKLSKLSKGFVGQKVTTYHCK